MSLIKRPFHWSVGADMKKGEFLCPSCKTKIEALEEYRGHQVQCPSCSQITTVPVNLALNGPNTMEKVSKGVDTIWSFLKGGAALVAPVLIGFFVFHLFNATEEETRGDKREGGNEEKYLPTKPASPEQIRHIQSALGEEYPISKGLTVRSRRFPDWYYVGASFFVQGVGQEVGIWIISGPTDKPGLMFSVDGFASEFSGMGEASRTKLGASVVDEEARALKAALKKF